MRSSIKELKNKSSIVIGQHLIDDGRKKRLFNKLNIIFWISSEYESAHKDGFFDTTHAFSEQKLDHFVHWGEADPTLSQ